jgi:hypothetical protein
VAGRAAAGRAAAAAAANDTPALDKDVGMLRKDLNANDLSAASKLELGVDWICQKEGHQGEELAASA